MDQLNSVHLKPRYIGGSPMLGQYRGNLREQKVRNDYTRGTLIGDDIV
jgi:hypothetical protein